jgi:2-amino-4-hydroxy-6-hydroxymethyldihydropteridine diphosphokinase
VRAYVGLGANVGDAAGTLAWAIGRLEELPDVRVRAVSRLYVTAPRGVTDQPDFHNAVVAIDLTARPASDPAAAALAFLARLKDLEQAAGRRPGQRWGPRELDLDLLVFGRHRISVERPPAAGSAPAMLEVPHRDAAERLFVLAPLAEVAPGLVPPGWGSTVETRRRQVHAIEEAGAVRAVGRWDPGAGRWIAPLAAEPAG